MRYAISILALMVLPGAVLAADANRFDGNCCLAARDALRYSFRSASTVQNGVLHGLHGVADQPSSLQIDATGPDGTGKLYAKGFTNSKEYVPGRDTAKGTEYDYDIDAHFGAAMRTGTRIEGRHARTSL
jgi:hypothetical protein